MHDFTVSNMGKSRRQHGTNPAFRTPKMLTLGYAKLLLFGYLFVYFCKNAWLFGKILLPLQPI